MARNFVEFEWFYIICDLSCCAKDFTEIMWQLTQLIQVCILNHVSNYGHLGAARFTFMKAICTPFVFEISVYASLYLMLTGCVSQEPTVNTGIRSIRQRIARLELGIDEEVVAKALGSPDLVSSQPMLGSPVRAAYRWVYGASQPDELPLGGVVIFDSRRKVLSWYSAGFSTFPAGPEKPQITQSETSDVDDYTALVFSIDKIFVNEREADPVLAQQARVSLIYRGRMWYTLTNGHFLSENLLVRVYDKTSDLVFCFDHPMYGRSYLNPGKRVIASSCGIAEEIAIWLTSTHVGRPRKGKYFLQLGYVLSADNILWSERVPFEVE